MCWGPVQHAKLYTLVYMHRHPLASLCSQPISCRRLRSQSGARISAGGVEGLKRKGLCQSRTLWGKAALKFIQSWSTSLNTDQRTGPVLRHRSGKHLSTLASSPYTYNHKSCRFIIIGESGSREEEEKMREWEKTQSVRSSYTRLLCLWCGAGAVIGRQRVREYLFMTVCGGRCGHVTICCCYFFFCILFVLSVNHL